MEPSTLEIKDRAAATAVNMVGVLAAIIGVCALLVATSTQRDPNVIAAGAIFSGGVLVSVVASAARNFFDIDGCERGWTARTRPASIYLSPPR